MLRVLAVLAAFALLVYAFADFASSDEEDRGDIPRWLWLVIIVLLPYFGPISWIAFSRSRRAQAGRPGARPAPGGATPRGRTRRRSTGPVAPDDDPDFLWRLAQEQRRQARDEGASTDTGTPSGAQDSRPADPRASDARPSDRVADDEVPGDDEKKRDDGAPA